MNNKFIKEIEKINKDIIKLNVSYKSLNTMKLEGNVKYLILPKTFMELKEVLKIINKYKIEYFLIGNGSNILFSNKNKECFIKLDFIKNKNNSIILANELLPKIANEFYKLGYSGFEYICNIPASIGGAIVMNAGAYNHNISDIIDYVFYIDKDLKFKILKKEDCCFGYRNSIFKNNKNIVLGCKIKIIEKDKSEIIDIMKECSMKRVKSQPLQYPNSGSIFKNDINKKAWQLIEEVGMKGYKFNGAMVSDKHCNFIVNYDNAKYEDIIYIITLIEKKIKDKYNIDIEREIIVVD